MNKHYKLAIHLVLPSLFLALTVNADAQSFRKGSLLISVSEGSTYATFTTLNGSSGRDVIGTGHISGARDPFTVEYGLSNHFGIGLNSGGDIYKFNPAQYYNFKTSGNSIKTTMGEFTVDGNYHFYITRRIDLAAFASLGFSSVSFSGNSGDYHYQYNAGGMIIRTGIKARYYFAKRFGGLCMISAFATQCGTNKTNDNTVADHYTTNISGHAIEFGLCYRILR